MLESVESVESVELLRLRYSLAVAAGRLEFDFAVALLLVALICFRCPTCQSFNTTAFGLSSSPDIASLS